MTRIDELEAEVARLRRLVLPSFGEEDLNRAYMLGRGELTERDYVRVAALTRARIAWSALQSLPPEEARDEWLRATRAIGDTVAALEPLVAAVEGEL